MVKGLGWSRACLSACTLACALASVYIARHICIRTLQGADLVRPFEAIFGIRLHACKTVVHNHADHSYVHRPVDCHTSKVRQQSSAGAQSHRAQDCSGEEANRLLKAEKRRADLEAAMVGGIEELESPPGLAATSDEQQDEKSATEVQAGETQPLEQHTLPVNPPAGCYGIEGISVDSRKSQNLVVLGTVSAARCVQGSAGGGATLVHAPRMLDADEAVRVASFERRIRWLAASAEEERELDEINCHARSTAQADQRNVLEAELVEIATYRELLVEDELQRRKLLQFVQSDRQCRAQVCTW